MKRVKEMAHAVNLIFLNPIVVELGHKTKQHYVEF